MKFPLLGSKMISSGRSNSLTKPKLSIITKRLNIAGVAIISAGRNDTCDFDEPNRLPCTSQFREAKGRCSNIATGKKTWGMIGTPYTRILAADYQDGKKSQQKFAFLWR